MKIDSKSTVSDVMRILDKHMSDGWRTVSKADFDAAENILLSEDLKYISGFARFLHTEEISKLSYKSLEAAIYHLNKTIHHIHLWVRWLKTHGEKQQLNILAINMLAAYSEEPPSMEELHEMLDKIKTIQKAFAGNLMLGNDVNEGLSEYVSVNMLSAAHMLEKATVWLQIIIEHISKCKKKGADSDE